MERKLSQMILDKLLHGKLHLASVDPVRRRWYCREVHEQRRED